MTSVFRFAARIRGELGRAFQERELYYRRDGELKFIRLRRSLQIGLACLAMVLCASLIASSLSLLWLNHSVDQRDQRIAAMATAYSSLRDELTANEIRLSEFARDLEAKHQMLSRAIEQRQSLHQSLDELGDELSRLDNRRQAAEKANEELRSRLAEVDQTVERAVGAAPGSDTEDKIARIIAERDGAVDDKRRLATTIATLEARLSDLSSVEAQFHDLATERDEAIARSERMADQVAHLEDRLIQLRTSQDDLIARVQEQTESDLGEIEAAIALTGLRPADLLNGEEGNDTALGGPLFALGSPHADPDSGSLEARFQTGIDNLEAHLSRWSGIQGLLERLPLSSPLDTYYVSSRFGKRRDPITKRWAMHYGIDVAGPRKSPVLSTAPGTVTFAGRKGPYGKLVEVDHGYGLTTRYGHLSKILVKEGQEIGYREKIGIMGNTGRSTGTHVHYEILYNGKPQDPSKFFEAGRYIFKG